MPPHPLRPTLRAPSPVPAPIDPTSLVRLSGVVKTYDGPSGPFTALDRVDLTVERGEFVAVVGRSGSGKSTLINVLTGLDTPTAGEIHVAGTPIHRLDQERLSRWRGRNVGVVFQFFQLLPTLSVAENVMLPMDLCASCPAPERRPRALGLLRRLGIEDQADKRPADLSGGQQQRAAIARALANDPPFLVADEPTGNLDSRTSGDVLDLFSALVDEGRTLVMVTHERDVGRHFTRVLTLTDGRLS